MCHYMCAIHVCSLLSVNLFMVGTSNTILKFNHRASELWFNTDNNDSLLIIELGFTVCEMAVKILYTYSIL